MALRDQDLVANDIDAGDLFRHRVFDLNSRVDLDEVELVFVNVEQEFDRSRVLVATAFFADRASDS